MSVTIYDWPSGVIPANLKWGLVANTQQFVSPLDQTVQTLELAGARWAAAIGLEFLTGESWRPFEAFITKLRGAAGRFFFSPPHAMTPRGLTGGSPVVSIGAQVGTALSVSGVTPLVTNWLRVGDYFSFPNGAGGYELKQAIADVNSDVNGNVTLQFEPPIRSSPVISTPITTLNPKTIFRLRDDEQGRIGYTPPVVGDLQLEIVEVF